MPDYRILQTVAFNYEGTDYSYAENDLVTETVGNADALAFLVDNGVARLSTYTPPASQTTVGSSSTANPNETPLVIGNTVTILENVDGVYNTTTYSYLANDVVTVASGNINFLKILVTSGIAVKN